jgi:hypothetical protein
MSNDHLACLRCREPLDRDALRLGNKLCSQCEDGPGWCRGCGIGLDRDDYYCVDCEFKFTDGADV